MWWGIDTHNSILEESDGGIKTNLDRKFRTIGTLNINMDADDNDRLRGILNGDCVTSHNVFRPRTIKAKERGGFQSDLWW
ncbi:hypothetical protein VNO78_07929 [Psophocarpus tetragonolobus]|uniref:Uncharacterized protein n=1 Tax=Psophocarpus tetragonolobus TaxID=3891 RepID=A0AAN9SWA4_PSOTE